MDEISYYGKFLSRIWVIEAESEKESETEGEGKFLNPLSYK